ncbi:hypothetical protein PGT21_033406 [Puccinia graminis f. sp. tritici]|uniref:Uncharacterized protein n=1 Tax=Puccinia graminis f. sp. tritici TaxID=56615 RepID=A0A5B0PCI0_PUCGR|nr:hypothetical protein PGT21_033406 [Puccinia graminis f. sp. tritici]
MQTLAPPKEGNPISSIEWTPNTPSYLSKQPKPKRKSCKKRNKDQKEEQKKENYPNRSGRNI